MEEFQYQDEKKIGRWINVTKQRKRRKAESLLRELHKGPRMRKMKLRLCWKIQTARLHEILRMQETHVR